MAFDSFASRALGLRPARLSRSAPAGSVL